jgi:hypothetical protein
VIAVIQEAEVTVHDATVTELSSIVAFHYRSSMLRDQYRFSKCRTHR